MSAKTAPEILVGEIPLRALYPSNEARALLGNISVPNFRRLTKSGALRTKKIGAYVYVERDEIKAFIDRLPSAAT